MPLARLSALQIMLDNTLDADIPKLKMYIIQASRMFESLVLRNLTKTQYTDTYNMVNGGYTLVFKQYPIDPTSKVTELKEGGIVIPSTDYTIIDERQLYYPTGFVKKMFNVEFTYEAGYSDSKWDTVDVEGVFGIPPDIEAAVLEHAFKLYQISKGGGYGTFITRITVAGQTLDVDESTQFSAMYLQTVKSYRRN